MRGTGGLGKAADRRAGSPQGFGHLVMKEAFPCEPGSCGTTGAALLITCRSGHRSCGYFRSGLNQIKWFYHATLPILCIKHSSLFSVLVRRSWFQAFLVCMGRALVDPLLGTLCCKAVFFV